MAGEDGDTGSRLRVDAVGQAVHRLEIGPERHRRLVTELARFFDLLDGFEEIRKPCARRRGTDRVGEVHGQHGEGRALEMPDPVDVHGAPS